MKQNILQTLLLCFLCFGLAACFDDDSSLETPGAAGEIVVAALPDTAVISYAGTVLEITPDMKGTTFRDDELEFAWYMYSGEDEDGYRANRIGDGKTLSYPVNLISGDYYFVFEVSVKATGLTRSVRMKVSASTVFSRGFYILKETTEGKTDLDLYTEQKGVKPDLMQRYLGAPLDGAPRNLAVVYNQAYINDDNQSMDRTNMLHVFTDGDYRGFRTEDMKQTFDRSTLRFEGLDADEVPLNMGNGMLVTFFLSNKGCYSVNSSKANSGRFGFPGGTGASRFMLPCGMNMAYWDDTEHHVYIVDRANGGTPFRAEYEVGGGNEENLTCIAAGQKAGTTLVMLNHWFMCEDKTDGSRWLYQVEGMAFFSPGVSRLRIDPSLHVAQADFIAGNALQATIIYAIHDGKLYTYNWTNGAENGPIALPGIGEGEELTYISNQYVNHGSDKFDNLVVATQKENEYKIYFYDGLVGGVPLKPAEKVAVGTGGVKCVRYVTPQLDFTKTPMNAVPLVPWCD